MFLDSAMFSNARKPQGCFLSLSLLLPPHLSLPISIFISLPTCVFACYGTRRHTRAAWICRRPNTWFYLLRSSEDTNKSDVLSRPRIVSPTQKKNKKMCHEEAKRAFEGTLGRLTRNRPITKAH